MPVFWSRSSLVIESAEIETIDSTTQVLISRRDIAIAPETREPVVASKEIQKVAQEESMQETRDSRTTLPQTFSDLTIFVSDRHGLPDRISPWFWLPVLRPEQESDPDRQIP